MVSRVILIAVCFAITGCSSSPEGAGGGSGDESLDIYEAAFRYHLARFPCTPDAAAHLSIDDHDIPTTLMDRLRRDWPNLKQLSEGDKGAVLRIHADRLEREGSDTATLRAGYWFPTRLAGQSRFGDNRLVRKGGRWVVESVTNEVIGCS